MITIPISNIRKRRDEPPELINGSPTPVFGILFVVFGISGGIQALIVGMGVLLLIYGIISIISLVVRNRLDAANSASRVK